MKISLGLFFIAFLSTLSLNAQPPQRKSVALTIYNQDLGVVREKITIPSKAGRYEVELTGIPEKIEPASIKLKLDGDVVEQNYNYDLVDVYKILNKYIDREITLVGPTTIKGTLLSAAKPARYEDPHIVIRNSDGGLTMLTKMDGYQISMPNLPADLVTKPTLHWLLEGKKSGAQDAELSYMTEGLSWRAEYVGTLDESEKYMNFLAWVSIENYSGTSFENANIELISGDVNQLKRIVDIHYLADYEDSYSYSGRGGFGTEALKPKPVFEYHQYTLPDPTTLKNKENKQIKLFEIEKVPVNKKYFYYGGDYVNVFLNFKNDKENKLGIPIPEGIARIFKTDGKSSQFVGENVIFHTPQDEKVDIKVGAAYDIAVQKSLLSKKKISFGESEYEYEILLRNHKNEDITIDVLLTPYLYIDNRKYYRGYFSDEFANSSVTVASSSEPYQMDEKNMPVATFSVKKGEEKKLIYTMKKVELNSKD